jgi:tetratricopeptide (TPR) repeat protein
MTAGIRTVRCGAAAVLLLAGAASAQPPQFGGNQPDFVRQGQQLLRDGKPEEALSLYQAVLKANPDSVPAHNAAGTLLDLVGKGEEARQHFQKVIDLAATPAAKANAQRAMAMSWAFSGNCKETVRYEQMVIQYYAGTKDFYQQGEMADEAARVCIDNGDLDTAYQWYQTGHDLGLKQPEIPADRKSLWEFRWEHAQARIAARKGNQSEADRHVKAAKAILDKDPEMARQQAAFYPYLVGYVALYRGDYQAALEQLQKANQNDAFIQCLMGDAYEKLGQKDKAAESYKKAAATTAHNPPAAFAVPYARKKLALPARAAK